MKKDIKVYGFIALALLAGCSSSPTCDEPEHYESARLGEKIVVPNGLDEPMPHRELSIPEPSARPSRPAGARCLDMPPAISSDS